jgi:hypothetical protein
MGSLDPSGHTALADRQLTDVEAVLQEATNAIPGESCAPGRGDRAIACGVEGLRHLVIRRSASGPIEGEQ